MIKTHRFTLAVATTAAVLGLLTSGTAGAKGATGTLIPVPPVPGSVETDIHGINDDNTIVGSYFTADNVAHGFFGTLDGQYTTFDYGGTASATNAFEINNEGTVTGWAKAPGFHFGYEFIRNPNGTIVTVTRNGSPIDGFMNGPLLKKKSKFVGSYWDSTNSVLKAYYGQKGKYVKDLTLPFSTIWTAARGSDSTQSVVVGDFILDDGTQSGWILKNGVETTINYPNANAAATLLWDINDDGLATGFWMDASSQFHTFMYNTRNSVFTQVDVPGATVQKMLGVNSAGYIAVDTDVGSFVYCPRSKRKCMGKGKEISTAASIHVAPAKFLNTAVPVATK